jgi:hypothetical protein
LNFLRAIPKEKLQKVILVAILTVIGVSVVGNFYVARQFSTWSASRRRIANLKRQIEEVERNKRQAIQNQQLCQQMASFVEVQQETMVSGDPFTWVVRQISLLAEQHPVRVLATRRGNKKQHELRSRCSVFTAQIDVEAGYDQLGVFLQDFENKFPTAEIRSLEISRGDDSRAQRRASLELAFLVRPDPVAHEAAGRSKEEKETP